MGKLDLLDLQDLRVLRDPVDSLFRGLRELLVQREREVRSVQLDPWASLEARDRLVETDPQERGVFQVMLDLRGDRDHLDQLELLEHLELQGQVGQQGLKEIKDFLVLLVPKAIREKEVIYSPKRLFVPSQDKCVNSSSRATCLAITPS